MVSPRCLLCDQVNPAGARFCNGCGSSLHVKRCNQCQTVNDQAARTCSKCSIEFTGLSDPPEGGANVVSPGHYGRFGSTHRFNIPGFDSDFHLKGSAKPAPPAAKVTAATQPAIVPEPSLGNAGSTPQLAKSAPATEYDKRNLTFDERFTFNRPTPSVRARSDRELTREPSSAANIEDVHRRWLRNDMAETCDSGPHIVTLEAHSSGGEVTSLVLAAQRETPKVPLATAERPPMSRVALVVLLPTMVLFAIGVSGYYVYSNRLQPSQGQGTKAVSAAPVARNAEDLATGPSPKIGVPPPPSAPSASLNTGGIASIETTGAAPPERSAIVTTSPTTQGTAAATAADAASSQTASPNKPSPSEPHPQVSNSAQAAPAQQFAAKSEGAVKERTAATAVAKDLRHRTVPAAGNEVTAKHSATNRPIRTRPKSPVVKACSQQERILGLCG